MNQTHKISFKEYCESKMQLREAVNNIPVKWISYTIKKYCKIPVGETKDEKEFISLKPKQKIQVKWKFHDPNDPLPIFLKVEDDCDIEDEEFKPFWTKKKLTEWLKQNAREDVK